MDVVNPVGDFIFPFTRASCFSTLFCHTKVYRPAHKYRFVVCFPHAFQLADKLVEQILHYIPATPGAEPGKSAVVRRFPFLQQPFEIDPVLAGLLQFPAGVDPAQIPMYQLNNTRGSAADFLPLEEYASYSFSYSSSSSWAFSRRTGAFSGIIISEFIASTS